MAMDDEDRDKRIHELISSSIPDGYTYRVCEITMDEFLANPYGCPFIMEVYPIGYDPDTPNVYHVERGQP